MKKFLLGLLFCSWHGLLLAQTADLELQQRLQQIKSLRATFSQTVLNHGRLVQRTNGLLSVKRPGGFRWQTNKPIRQLIVADPHTLWIYDQDLNQVTIKNSKSISGTPALFLSGNISSINKYYKVEAATLGNGVVYTLTPLKRQNNFRYIQIRFEGNAITGMRMLDHLDQNTDLRLYDVQVNVAMNSSQFKFQPPSGADVIKQR